MNFDAQVFDPDAIDDDGGNGDFVLPPGRYRCMCNSAEVAEVRNDGRQLVLDWVIIDGQYSDWHIWDRITLRCASDKAVEVGRKQLKRLCAATGVGRFPWAQIAQVFAGKTCIVKSFNDEYNGRKSAKVKFYESHVSAPTHSMPNAHYNPDNEPPF